MKRNVKIAFVGVIAVIIAIAIAAFILNDTAQVVIDAGHGGNDVGAEYNGRYEKDDNLALALLVADKLSEKGIDVALTSLEASAAASGVQDFHSAGTLTSENASAPASIAA